MTDGFDNIRFAARLRLYAVTDTAWLNGRTLAQCVQEAIEGGATMVQLRDKDASTQELVAQAKELLPVCRAGRVPLIIDDDVTAAEFVGADGVHVGQDDVSCRHARAELGEEAIIGVSVGTVAEAKQAEEDGADYLGVCVHPTPTKTDAVPLTADELRAICEAVSIPVVAIGGMNVDTIPELEGTGVEGAAVVSALFAADDIRAAAVGLTRALDEAGIGVLVATPASRLDD